MMQLPKQADWRAERRLETRAAQRWLAFTALLSAVVAAPGAGALDLGYQADLSVGHSDNIARTQNDEVDETIASAGLQFSLGQLGPRLQADVTGNFAYYDYQDDTFESELVGNFAGNARLDLIPERFTWMLSDNYGQVLSDPFQPATPDNREDINYLTTGPDLVFLLGTQARLRLGARYAMTTYETSPFDSSTISGEIGLSRDVSAASSLSLNLRTQETEYDEAALNADYGQSEAFLQYSATGARTSLTVDAGYTELDRDADTSSQGGLLLRLNMSRRVSPSSVASLNVGREYSSAGEVFAQGQNAGIRDLGTTPGRQTDDPFTNEYAGLGWDFARNRTMLSLHASYSDRSYEDQPQLDETLTTFRAELGRELSSVARVSLNSTLVRSQTEEAERGYDEIGVGGAVSWRLSSHVTISLIYDHFDRSSDAVLDDYTENRYWLSIGYGRGQLRDRQMQPSFAVDSGTPGT